MKSALSCALVLGLAVLVAAPASAATTFNFGLKAGVSLSNVRWSDDDGSEMSLIQPTFGGFVLVSLTPSVGIQPEVNYLVQGEKWEGVTEKFTYLQIPVLLRIKVMQEGKFVPVVFAGPAVGFLLSATETGFGDVKEFFKSTDFAGVFGVGAEIGMGKTKAVVDLRYNLGFTNDYSAGVDSFSMKTAAFSLTAGILF